MENLNETIQFLIQSLQTYTGNNPIWILYPVAMILIWFLGKKGDLEEWVREISRKLPSYRIGKYGQLL